MSKAALAFLVFVLSAPQGGALTRTELRGMAETGHSPKKTGALKTLTLLVRSPETDPYHTRDEMNRVVYEDLNAYVKWCSYGAARIEGTTLGWFAIPDLNASGFNLFNKKIEARAVREYITGVLDFVQDRHDVSGYDHLILMGASLGRPYGFNGMAGPFEDYPFPLRHGKVIRHLSLYSEFAHLGQIAHDFFHQIGGTRGRGPWPKRERVCPCLYSNEQECTPGGFFGVKYFSIYMGPWDPMALHRIGLDIPPAGTSSFTRMRLGWIPAGKIRTVARSGGRTRLRLAHVGDPAGEILAVKVPLSKDTYYLIENRQPVAYDAVLPDEGILVYRVDESMVRDHGKAFSGPVRIMDADPSWPRFRRATFTPGRPLFVDAKRDLALWVEEKEGTNYRISILDPFRATARSDAGLGARIETAQEKMEALAVLPAMEEVRRLVPLAAKDGTTVTGEYFRARRDGPAVLMVPGYDGSAESLEPLPYVFYRAGISALAIDLRTLPAFRKQVAAGVPLRGEFAPLPGDLNPLLLDIEAGHRFLEEEGYDTIGLLAASYGGGLGLKYAFHEPGIGAVAILSLPFGDYGGVNLKSELARNVRPELPLFFAYATEDVVAPAVRQLAPALDRIDRRRGRYCEVRSYPGKSHGNDLLHSHPELETDLIEWYLSRLGR